MSFINYCQYYDAINRDKPYKCESHYIAKLIKKYKPDATSLLEVGCGTGKYTQHFHELGFRIHGIEKSDQMISNIPADADYSYEKGDAITYKSKTQFDCCIALFHVVNYFESLDNLRRFFEHARSNLTTAGLLLFDTWHSPAVRSIRPENRIRKVTDGNLDIVRFATPTVDDLTNTVTVEYDIYAQQKGEQCWQHIHEIHTLRHFSPEEIVECALKEKFELLESHEWNTEKTPGDDTWSVTYILKKGQS